MGFGSMRRFNPATETVSSSPEVGNLEISPEELAERPAPDLSMLPEIVQLRKMTFNHLHALFALFKEADEKDSGLEEARFDAVFRDALSQALGDLRPVFWQLAKPDASNKSRRVSFSDFVNFLLQHVQVARPHPTSFRTEGVTLAGDEDSPLCSRISKPAGLPPISEMSKMGLVHMRALLSKFHSNDSGDGLEMDQFVTVMSEVLPGMSAEALEAQFMKVDANSDGSVSWDEFSNFILAAGNASDANSSKQEGGALLEGPEPDLNKEVLSFSLPLSLSPPLPSTLPLSLSLSLSLSRARALSRARSLSLSPSLSLLKDS